MGMNGLLNFNFVFIAALLVLPIQGLAKLLLQGEPRGPSIFLPDWLSQAPLHLWLLVFWLQPHKEERFLFPIYPLICLAGAMVIDSCQKLFYFAFVRVKSQHFLAHTRWLGVLVIAVTSIISLSRMAALYQGYHGVTDTWMAVNQLEENVQGQTTVCMGKEWHRFPSSFFLPNQNFRIAFLKSEFRGQLPKYYPKASDGLLPTQVVSPDFNDLNLEEESRYIAHAGKCHYIVDLENSAVTDLQPRYADSSNWTVQAEFDFLDSAGSHPIFRAFFVPWLSKRFCKFNRYLLLART